MLRLINIGLVFAIVAGAGWTFSIKHQAEESEARVRALQRQIALEKETIDILKADWAYLNNPSRLQRIVDAFEAELGLQAVEPEQLITLDELPARPLFKDVEDEIAASLQELDVVTTGSVDEVAQ